MDTPNRRSYERSRGFKKVMYGESPFWDILLEGVAELVGTAILIFLGCMGCVGSLGVQPSHIQSTLTFGLAVMLVIQCFAHISHAHLNPAITVGALVLGKKTVLQACVYFFAQMIGAILGYGVLKVVTPTGQLYYTNENATDQFCVTVLNVRWYQGLMVEALTTGILMLLACAIWDERNAKNTDSAAIKFGLAVTCLAAVSGPYTGCSMNPARSFAPAIWNNQWADFWVYWLGPLSGSFLSSFGYRMVFGYKSNKAGQTIPEAVALNCVDAEKREHL